MQRIPCMQCLICVSLRDVLRDDVSRKSSITSETFLAIAKGLLVLQKKLVTQLCRLGAKSYRPVSRTYPDYDRPFPGARRNVQLLFLLLISVQRFRSERSSSFVQSTLQEFKRFCSLLIMVLFEFGEECFHRCRIWTSNHESCLTKQFRKITIISF